MTTTATTAAITYYLVGKHGPELFTTSGYIIRPDDGIGGAGVREPRRPYPEGPRDASAALTVG